MNKTEDSAPIWTANRRFLQSKEHTWQPMMSNNEQRAILLKIIVLIEKWMGNWNMDCLKWEDKGMRAELQAVWSLCLHSTWTWVRLKECPHYNYLFLGFSGGSGEWGVGKVLLFFLPHITSVFCFCFSLTWCSDHRIRAAAITRAGSKGDS